MAEPGQILLTENAKAMVPESLGIEFESLTAELGGEQATIYNVKFMRG